jgi:MFS family permease
VRVAHAGDRGSAAEQAPCAVVGVVLDKDWRAFYMRQLLANRLPFYYGWVVVAVVFISMGLGVNARTAFSLVFPPIVAEMGWNHAVVAGAFSFGFMVSALFSPLLGRLMDVHGPRVVMLFGATATSVGLMGATYVSEPWHLYVSLGVLVGGGSVCLGYSGQSLFLPSWFVRRRGFAMSLAFSGVGVGSIVLFPLLQTYIEATNWRQACFALGLLTLVVLGPLNMLLTRRPEDLALLPDGDSAPEPGAAVVRKSNVVDEAWAAVDWTLERAMKTTRFWWLAVGYFFALYAWYAVQVHQTEYLLTHGFLAADAAWALGVVSLLGVPGQIGLGFLSDRWGREWIWTIGTGGFVATYVALMALASAAHMELLWVMVVVQGAFGYGVTSVFGAIPAEIFEGKHYGSIFGTLMLCAISGGAVGPWLTGWIHDVAGDYVYAWQVGIAASVLSALAIWMAAPRKVRLVAGRLA